MYSPSTAAGERVQQDGGGHQEAELPEVLVVALGSPWMRIQGPWQARVEVL
ncbi:hypothetical protein ACFV4P_35060 [Kitasatospora sp. NPDC059795]|uniref:hypothetical protein n=1 Tax=Kitasatospora sp. NPDC059795 TaxID=3346949 RepID=UPI0036468004